MHVWIGEYWLCVVKRFEWLMRSKSPIDYINEVMIRGWMVQMQHKKLLSCPLRDTFQSQTLPTEPQPWNHWETPPICQPVYLSIYLSAWLQLGCPDSLFPCESSTNIKQRHSLASPSFSLSPRIFVCVSLCLHVCPCLCTSRSMWGVFAQCHLAPCVKKIKCAPQESHFSIFSYSIVTIPTTETLLTNRGYVSVCVRV